MVMQLCVFAVEADGNCSADSAEHSDVAGN